VRSKLPLISGVAILLAATGVIAAVWSNGTNNSAACTPYIHAPVPVAAMKALASYAGRIEHDNEDSRDGTRDEWWFDPLTGSRRQIAFDSRGRITQEFGTTIHGGVERNVWVLYDGRTWTSDQQTLTFRVPHVVNDAARIAQDYRDKVANGRATIIGREVLGGRETLHLREIQHLPPPPVPKGMRLPKSIRFPTSFRIDAWVDPLTYVPVRTRATGSVTDESWLPRTPTNIAKTKVVIPPGFKHPVPQEGHFSSSFVEIGKTSC
jgi:hypothetical protein